MLVDMVRGCRSGPRCCRSVWEVSEVCCEGFWREIPRPGIGCSSDGSISIVHTAKSQISPISAKIPIHPGFSWFFAILSAANRSKRFVRSLRFVNNILSNVWNTTLCVKLEKHRNQAQNQLRKGYKFAVHRDSCNALPVLGNLECFFCPPPPAPSQRAPAELVQTAILTREHGLP